MGIVLDNLIIAQDKSLDAFGLKKVADASLKQLDLLKDWETTPNKNLEKTLKIAVENQVLIDEIIKQGKIDI